MCHAQNYCAETFCPGHKAHLHQKPRNASELYIKICCHILRFKSENSIMASSMEKSGKNVPNQCEGHRSQADVALALKAEETPVPPHTLDGTLAGGGGGSAFCPPTIPPGTLGVAVAAEGGLALTV